MNREVKLTEEEREHLSHIADILRDEACEIDRLLYTKRDIDAYAEEYIKTWYKVENIINGIEEN